MPLLETHVRLAYAAYCDADQLRAWECLFCDRQYIALQSVMVVDVEPAHLRGYVGYDAKLDAFHVEFRGTEMSSLHNWITDMTTTSTQFANSTDARVHKGFYSALQQLWSPMWAQLQYMQAAFPTCHKYVLGGHSLGGALAELFAAQAVWEGRLPAHELSLVTFGTPRVGNAAYTELLASYAIPHTRVVWQRDIVPHVPPRSFGFQHTTREYWYFDELWAECSADDGEDPLCSDSLTLTTSVADHLSYMGIAEDCTGASRAARAGAARIDALGLTIADIEAGALHGTP